MMFEPEKHGRFENEGRSLNNENIYQEPSLKAIAEALQSWQSEDFVFTLDETIFFELFNSTIKAINDSSTNLESINLLEVMIGNHEQGAKQFVLELNTEALIKRIETVKTFFESQLDQETNKTLTVVIEALEKLNIGKFVFYISSPELCPPCYLKYGLFSLLYAALNKHYQGDNADTQTAIGILEQFRNVLNLEFTEGGEQVGAYLGDLAYGGSEYDSIGKDNPHAKGFYKENGYS